jgi:PAS domain S-box-containing protein
MTDESQRGHFHLLAAVGDVADGTRLLGETVQRLLDVIVPAFADVATLDAVSVTGEMRRLGARVSGPDRERLETALLARHQSGDTSVGVLKTVMTGESQLLAPLPDTALRAISTDDADYGMLRSLDLQATMYVPLPARGRTLGVLSCSMAGSRRGFTAEDQRFAEALGSRIGLALDNAGLSQTVSGLEKRLEATLANLAAAVVAQDPDGRMVLANAAAADLLGAASVEALFALPRERLLARFDIYDEDGQPVTLAQLPTGRALAGQRAVPSVVRTVDRVSGTVRWLSLKATPVPDEMGSLALVVSVVEDITQEKRRELSQRLLAQAGRELASSLDFEQTLQRVARLAVPVLGDWCRVAIRGTGNTLDQVAIAHADPAKVALARDLAQRHPMRTTGRTGAARVIRSGEPLLITEITDEVLADASPQQIRLVREVGMRSVMIVPLAVPGREPFGTLTLAMAESGRRFADEDLVVAEELGRLAAAAVENARLYSERSRIASMLQRSLLPPALPEMPGFDLAALYQPAGEGNEVGGDFYDAFRVPSGWMIVVGDVAGHGAEAAALTSLSRYTLRTAAQLLNDPVAALQHLNSALRERPQLSLVSVCCAIVGDRAGEMVADVVLAGHPPPYHVCSRGAQPVGTPGLLLGMGTGGRWTATSVTLLPGDLLVLYSDGVIDTFGDDERFGEARLADAVRGSGTAEDAVQRIRAALTAFGRGPQRDDTAALVVQRVQRD